MFIRICRNLPTKTDSQMIAAERIARENNEKKPSCPREKVFFDAEVTTLHLRNEQMRIVYTNPFTGEKVTDNCSSKEFFEQYKIVRTS